MKINIIKNKFGLFEPLDEDIDKANKISIGDVFCVNFTKMRDSETHRKYFKLLGLCWDFMTEDERQTIYRNSFDKFRKRIQLLADYTDEELNEKGEWCLVAKSIAYENLDEVEFNQLYKDVKEVLFKLIVSKLDNIYLF